MKPSNVDIVIGRQHGRDMCHPPPDPIQGRYRMVLRPIVFYQRLSYSVTNETKICRWRKFDTSNGRGLGTIQWTGFEELSKPSSRCSSGASSISSRRRCRTECITFDWTCVETNRHDMWYKPAICGMTTLQCSCHDGKGSLLRRSSLHSWRGRGRWYSGCSVAGRCQCTGCMIIIIALMLLGALMLQTVNIVIVATTRE